MSFESVDRFNQEGLSETRDLLELLWALADTLDGHVLRLPAAATRLTVRVSPWE